MKLAIAGTYFQFRHYTREYWHEYKYIYGLPEGIRGQADTTLTLIGSWFLRQDVANCWAEVEHYCLQHDISIGYLHPHFRYGVL